MQIRRHHLLYGILLTQLAEDGTVTVERLSDHRGHFRIDEHFLLAKTTTRRSPNWYFTVQRSEISKLKADRLDSYGTGGRSFLALVCGTEKICLLRPREWDEVLDTRAYAGEHQSLTVAHEDKCALDVSGSDGEIDHQIPANRFPEDLV